jgi:hypothetical protein
MALLDEIKGARDRRRRLTVYLKFEHAVVLVLTALLSLIISWLRGQYRANPSLAGNSLLTGKITGNIAEFRPNPHRGRAAIEDLGRGDFVKVERIACVRRR